MEANVQELSAVTLSLSSYSIILSLKYRSLVAIQNVGAGDKVSKTSFSAKSKKRAAYS
jgi:hypothetical protein